MTHNDIYVKFMIEYDKANVTSSYPSLTEYEVATVLDKAYNALIAQKITGNNVRRSVFESDIKSISDLQNLVVTDEDVALDLTPETNIANVVSASLNSLSKKFLYFVSCTAKFETDTSETGSDNVQVVRGEHWTDEAAEGYEFSSRYTGVLNSRYSNLKLVGDYPFVEQVYLQIGNGEPLVVEIPYTFTQEEEELLTSTPTTLHVYTTPTAGNSLLNRHIASTYIDLTADYTKIVKNASAYPYAFDGNNIRSYQVNLVPHSIALKFFVTASNMPWVKSPVCFIESGKMYVVYDPLKSLAGACVDVTYIKVPEKFAQVKTTGTPFSKAAEGATEQAGDIEFECNDTMAEELISLAITFALENVESQRLSTKLNTRGLEG